MRDVELTTTVALRLLVVPAAPGRPDALVWYRAGRRTTKGAVEVAAYYPAAATVVRNDVVGPDRVPDEVVRAAVGALWVDALTGTGGAVRLADGFTRLEVPGP